MNTPHPYPVYKPSGVPWLGDVPEHWNLVRLKHAFQINPETLSEDTDPEYLFDYMDINSVGTGYMSSPPVRQVFGNAPSRARRVMRTGDTAISTVRTYLKAAYHLQRDWPNLITSTGFAILRPPVTIVPALLGHIVQSDAFVPQVVANSIGVAYPAISETKLGTLFLVFPPLPEQAAIVCYLDYVDRRIRRYVGAKRKLIALLEEERQAIVNQSVTRGLDPNVRLKPSGVEWLGDVPEHWEVVQLGRVGKFSKGGGGTKEDEVDVGLPCIRYGDIYMNYKYHIERSRSYISLERSSTYTPMQYGDILFAGSGETIDEIGKSAVNLLDGEAYCGGDVILFRPGIEVNPRFAGYATDCVQSAYQKSCLGRGITIMHIYSSQLKYMFLTLPPVAEQTVIAAYLDKATADIDSAIARARRQIELVQEYRTRLIADVVTGKLDVREAAAQLPDEADEEHPIEEGYMLTGSLDNNSYISDESLGEELAMESEVTA